MGHSDSAVLLPQTVLTLFIPIVTTAEYIATTAVVLRTKLEEQLGEIIAQIADARTLVVIFDEGIATARLAEQFTETCRHGRVELRAVIHQRGSV